VIKYLLFIIPFLLFAQKPKLLLLGTYKDQNVTGWVMSEKLDGIRAYWDGEKLLSRSGKEIKAPEWFITDYPPFAIDGELWTKRGDFERISSIVRDQTPSDEWREVKHYIFEVPQVKGDLHDRLAKVKPYANTFIKIIEQIAIRDKKHLSDFHKDIESKGGEGVVVRDPKAPYISKRTHRALKVKSFKDQECRVIGYTEGKGKFEGVMGAIVCQLDNKIEFKIGSGFSDIERSNPPKIGAIVTFQYQEFTKYGKPRFPVFLRVREQNSDK
jgi:DNA ligase-1